MSEVLDVDLLVFENSTGPARRAVVDGVVRSLATGFAYTRHDLSEDLTVLSPVSSCCTPEHPQRFTAITAVDALDKVLYEINLVEAARRI